jgi:hypothetical protein
MRGVSFSMERPGASWFITCAPPTESSGRMATIRTRIPIPPSHWLSWRHISMAWPCFSTEMVPRTVAPVVVNPLILSNSALTNPSTVSAPTVPVPATR